MEETTYIRNERGSITTDLRVIKRLVREYHKLCAHKYNNLLELDKFLELRKLPKLTEEKMNNLSLLISNFKN